MCAPNDNKAHDSIYVPPNLNNKLLLTIKLERLKSYIYSTAGQGVGNRHSQMLFVCAVRWVPQEGD